MVTLPPMLCRASVAPLDLCMGWKKPFMRPRSGVLWEPLEGDPALNEITFGYKIAHARYRGITPEIRLPDEDPPMPLPPRAQYARVPTPIEPLRVLSRELDVDLRVKRDDLTGSWLTGNKVRKLEYLIPDAQAQGCCAVVTFGAVDSNHCRATAIVAAQAGLKCHLILRGDEPEHLRGNLLLDRMVGATTTFIHSPHFTERVDAAEAEAVDRFASQGLKTYVIPIGGSNEVGALGYIEAVAEIKNDAERSGWTPDVIVVPVGSGGTFAGVLLGAWMHIPSLRVFGVNVCATAKDFEDKAFEDCMLANERFELGLEIKRDDVVCQEGYVGAGYAQTTDEQLLYYTEVARKEALILDPVYTGKTFWGMVHEIEKGTFAPGAKILFLHTGGVFGLEPYGPRIGDLLSAS